MSLKIIEGKVKERDKVEVNFKEGKTVISV